MNESHLRGIVLIMAATAALTVMDGFLKALAAHYPAMQVASLRGVFSLPLLLAWIGWRHRSFSTLLNVRWGWQIGRGILGIVMLSAFIYALNKIPLSEAYALFFIAPLLITALSVPILGESVGPRRWAAVVIGFVGVLVIVRPGAATINLASLAVLLTALGYSVNAISVRILGRTDSTAAMSFWFIVVVAVGGGLIALPNWVPVRLDHLPLLVGLGVSGVIGQVSITEAFRCAPASVIAPFEYSALLWGLLLDLTIFGEVPTPIVFVGSAIIIGSGLYLMRRENRAPIPTRKV